MSDPSDADNPSDANHPSMEAARYPDGTILYPPHPLGPGGEEPVGTVDLSEHTATIITWTSSTATPPGVRQPNHLAIVEFDIDEGDVDAKDDVAAEGDVDAEDDVDDAFGDVNADPSAIGDGETVRAIGQLTTDAVEIGDRVEPVYAAELRDPDAGIREPASQSWDGYRFRPIE